MKLRAGCARWVAAGGVRINRQPTDKPHARLRPGDVLTLSQAMMPDLAVPGVRVIRVLALAVRRGPATEARTLYEELAEPACPGGESAAYRPN